MLMTESVQRVSSARGKLPGQPACGGPGVGDLPQFAIRPVDEGRSVSKEGEETAADYLVELTG
eukprot:1043361-Rhodomonas_salina.2